MRVGIIGTGGIAALHASAYHALGFPIVACTNTTAEKGRRFAAEHGADFIPTIEDLCRDPRIDFVDLSTMPNFRLAVVELCAAHGKHLIVEKPIATDLDTAHRMIAVAHDAGIQLGVISQRRFDDGVLFLRRAIEAGRLGRILQADAYVKWWRAPEYYARPIKGSWAFEGGGALINQGIHYADLLLHLIGPVAQVSALWQLGGLHNIESEDSVSAVLRFARGATGVLQASTAIWPGYPERLEIHGSNGTAILTGDKLTTWDLREDVQAKAAPPPLIERRANSGASDPLAISTVPFERQIQDFAASIRERRPPLISGEDGYRALELVQAIYASARANGQPAIISTQ